MENSVINIKNASICFKKYEMKPINLEIPKGYIIGIQGDNGAGKSTLLKMIMGAYKKMQGTILVEGIDVVHNREEALKKLGYIDEKRKYFEEENALDNGKCYAHFYENWDEDEYTNMLKWLKVPVMQRVGSFSKGERVKYQLAFATAYKPTVLLLDEPTAGLDPVFRDDFLKVLQEFVANYETTILLSTHLEDDLKKIADYIIDVDNGFCKMREV